MTKMAAMVENLQISSPKRVDQWQKYYNVYINDPVVTFTHFTIRSTWVAHAFELGKTFKKSFEVKILQEMPIGLNIKDSEKHWTQGLICPNPGAIYMYEGWPSKSWTVLAV